MQCVYYTTIILITQTSFMTNCYNSLKYIKKPKLLTQNVVAIGAIAEVEVIRAKEGYGQRVARIILALSQGTYSHKA